MKKFKLTFIIFIALIVSLYITSCNFQDTSAVLKGDIYNLKGNENIMLALWTYGHEVTGTFPLLEKKLSLALDNKRPTSFTWLTRTILNGKFIFAAYDDKNENLMYDEDEQITFYGKNPIEITPKDYIIENLNITFGAEEIPWRDILDKEFNKFFSYLNNRDQKIFGMIHPILYFDHYLFDYDRITEYLYDNYLTTATYPGKISVVSHKGTFDTVHYKSYGNNGALIEGLWEMERPKGSFVDTIKEDVNFAFIYDDYTPYIIRIDPITIDAGIAFKSPGDNSVNSESYKIKFMWVNSSKKISAVYTYDIKLQVFTTPSECAYDLYGDDVTNHTYQWSDPITFYTKAGTLVNQKNIPQNAGGGSFTFGQQISQTKIIPYQFVTYDGTHKDFVFNSKCLYKVTVWIDEINNSDTETPFGSMFLVGINRGQK